MWIKVQGAVAQGAAPLEGKGSCAPELPAWSAVQWPHAHTRAAAAAADVAGTVAVMICVPSLNT